MKLYEHVTDGGAEYYTTVENDIKTVALRTDGYELEVSDFARLKELGFKSVVINGERTIL